MNLGKTQDCRLQKAVEGLFMKKAVFVCNLSPHEGSCVIHGRTWRWVFGDYVGPTFVDAKGESLKHQPSEKNHLVWEKFHDWLEELKGPLPWREAERMKVKNLGKSQDVSQSE